MNFKTICCLFFAFIAGMPWLRSQPEADAIVSVDFQVYLWQGFGGDVPENNEPAQGGVHTSTDTLAAAAVFATEAAPQTQGGDARTGELTRQYQSPTIHYLSGDQSHSIRISEGRLSGTYRYTGPSPLTFFRNKPVGEATQPQQLGSVQLSPGAGKVLLIFIPDGSNTFRILPIENSPQRIPEGKALLYNFTNETVACQFGQEQFMLPPGRSRQIDISGITGYRLPVQLAVGNPEGQWQRKLAENKIIHPDSSLLMIIHRTASDTGHYRVLTLRN